MLSNAQEKYVDIGIPSSYWDSEIEVVCPDCNKASLVHNKNECVTFTCLKCGKNEKIQKDNDSYYPTKYTGKKGVDPFFKYDLFLQEDTKNGSLWVYNADQLSHLKAYTCAKLREKKEKDKYFDYYLSFFHKLPAWVKSAKNREIVLNKIAKLEKKAITNKKNKTPYDILEEIEKSFFYRWNWKNNRSWRLLEYSDLSKNEFKTTYYPDFKKNILLQRGLEENTLLIKKTIYKGGFIGDSQEIIAALSLKQTTKKPTCRHVKVGKPTKFLSYIVRNLNDESFSAKELLVDVAKIEIDRNLAVSNEMINFQRNDYIIQFIESNEPNLDIQFDKGALVVEYGFTKSALEKIMSSLQKNK